MLTFIVIALTLYALVAYVRRKTAKPNYKGKTVWITGASSGLGQYMAYEFNRNGAHVILSARNQNELERVKNSCPHPESAQVLPMDMVNFAAVRQMTANLAGRLEKEGKTLDVVVENAGVSMRCEFVDYPFQNHQKLFEVNVDGPYNHLQSVIPIMIKQKKGQIVGISSLAGKLATAYRTSYAGSKHAFIGIMDSLRTELRPYGIRVCNVMPGYIKTNISKNALASQVGQSFGKTDKNIESGMEPDKFAREAVGAIWNNENEVSIGEQWKPVLGLVLRNLCPDLFFRGMDLNAKNQSKAVKEAKQE